MYPWVTHTWNIVKGKCPHSCSYCYMKRFPQAELRFDSKELKTDLGSGNFIFVGSSCDMWAESIPEIWIQAVLWRCMEHPNNKYLFQSKNPSRFKEFKGLFPSEFIVGTTIETNRTYSNETYHAPYRRDRYEAMAKYTVPKMVSIEPIIDFDNDILLDWMQEIKPEFVSIGADSGYNHLPEPSPDKVKALIEALKEFTEVKVKDNLSRLLNSKGGEG